MVEKSILYPDNHNIMSFLDELNQPQREAALHTQGPSMIIAGAGSGKTKTLTYRIAHLIEQGVDPFQILALTFTNKAAKEMKERIYAILGEPARNIWMGTFHSIFSKILRVDGEHLGYTRSFTIYDTDDAKKLITTVVKGLNLDPKVYNSKAMYSRISMAKNNLIGPQAYAEDPEIQAADREARKWDTRLVYEVYNRRLKEANAMDFDDLLFNTNVLFRDFPEVLKKYQTKFQHILVDEYQDTNFSQYLIVKKLAAVHQNLCVVGDDAQSIYAFRGANITNILNFSRDYPQTKLFKLEQNYRSTKIIVQAANEVIKNNQKQITKEIWTANEQGEKVRLFKVSNEKEEGRLIAQEIKELSLKKRVPYKDIAILYRVNNLSRAIEDGLRSLNIPYKIYSGHAFYSRKEIKDVMAYFRLVINHSDNEAFERIINYPARGIGSTTLDRLNVYAHEHKLSLFDTVARCENIDINLNSGTRKKLLDFALMIQSLSQKVATTPASVLAEEILQRSGIVNDLKQEGLNENQNRLENIAELINAVKEYMDQDDNILDELTGEVSVNTAKTLDLFLQQSTLMTDADTKADENSNSVSLMTVHSAKGLEFDYVYIAGMEESIFPSILSSNSRSELEEERRLFYVAVTRARKQLTLSHTELRYRFGEPSFSSPSRFITELGEDNVETPAFSSLFSKQPKPTFIRKPAVSPTPSQSSQPVDVSTGPLLPIESIVPNLKVSHYKFGTGVVIKVEGEGDNKKARVNFAVVGEKQLLLRFAKLKKA